VDHDMRCLREISEDDVFAACCSALEINNAEADPLCGSVHITK
jgi:hypothetical protein